MASLLRMSKPTGAPPPRTPEREALAAALNVAMGMTRTMVQAERAVARALVMVKQARAQADEAKTAAEVARETYRTGIITSARTGTAFTSTTSHAELVRAEADALAVLEAAEAALVAMTEEHAEAERAARRAGLEVRRCATVVLCACLPALEREARAQLEALTQTAGVIRYVARLGRDDGHLTYDNWSSLRALADNVEVLVTNSAVAHRGLPPAPEWAAALEALVGNADAPFPGDAV